MTSKNGHRPLPSSPNSQRPSRRPTDSRFFQQELSSCRPLLTPRWVVAIYMLVAVVFIPVGVISLLASRRVVEVVHRYDDSCPFENSTMTVPCKQHLTVPKHMNRPIFVYYEIEDFYQNHRRYVRSLSYTQLLTGDKATDTSKCKPEENLPNNDSSPIIPCGLIAWSLFNDTYNFTYNGLNITVDKSGISWKTDQEHKFGANVYPRNFANNNANISGIIVGGAELDPHKPLNEDENLIVWMETAALPSFRKLYGRIDQDLAKNTTLTVNIHNVYHTHEFGGKKKLILSTTTWIGGKNDFSGLAYLTVGLLCIFLALVFVAAHLKNPRPLGDAQYFSWNRR